MAAECRASELSSVEQGWDMGLLRKDKSPAGSGSAVLALNSLIVEQATTSLEMELTEPREAIT